MYADRSAAQLAQADQWARCVHQNTVLLPDGGVGLDWDEVPPPSRWDEVDGRCDPPAPPHATACPAGIVHDRWCRTWRTRPELGTVEVGRGKDAPRSGCPDGLRRPTGIAVDSRDRLYVVEAQARTLMVGDLRSGRVLRRVPIAGRPVDVVSRGGSARPEVLVLTRSPARVVVVDGTLDPCPPAQQLHRPCAHHSLRPARITLLSGRPVVLWRGHGHGVIADLSGRELVEVPHATDLEGGEDGLLVVAVRPGEPFRRFRERDGVLVEDEPLAAADYDGGAVTINPAGRIVYTTPAGSRSTQGTQARHARHGVVTTYRLDSGAYRTRWGRVFLEACLPTGTGLLLRAVTSDEDDVVDPMPAAAPGRGNRPVPRPDLTPPLPPSGAMDAAMVTPVVERRSPTALATPFANGADATTYESGIDAPPGRYLWLQLELTGTERTSPTVRALRVERPGHALLSALPRMFSAVDEQADFLQGFLTPAEGMLHDLDTAAADRGRLVDPFTAPADFLPWLASLAGIVLDRRWSEDSRRALLAEVYQLYARRGTAAALERLLHLYLGRRPRIVERWRLRGIGGGFLGAAPAGLDAPSVRGTARTSGMLGHFTVGGAVAGTDSYTQFAHRFTVLVPGCLSEEQREVVHDIVGSHKPSHTIGDVCELGDGLPVGRLRLGLTAYVGPRAGRETSVLGGWRLGHGSTVGTAELGSRLGETRLGGVRVG